MMPRRLPWGAACCLALGACSGWQSASDPQGPQAQVLNRLFWLLTVTCAVVWALVMLMLVVAVWRWRPEGSAPLAPDPRGEPRSRIAVGMAVAATVIVISGLTLASYLTTRQISKASQAPLAVRVRGYQWWWEVTYEAASPDQVFLTANELHVPVGREVRVELSAADVIHSFWIPNLMGKQDMIPGRDNSVAFTVSKPGVYRGQCAEFCGLQHAHMALLVVAEAPEEFEHWRIAQLAEPSAPHGGEEAAGRRIFERKACAACHAVRGTSAAGTLGPDLTHVGGRATIAAGLLPTTRGSLAAWIADPQTIKPGNNMPMVPLSAEELKSVSAYLASLR
jgi:cytochrome c oxidase subunit II